MLAVVEKKPPSNHKTTKGRSRRTHGEVPQLNQLAKGTGESTLDSCVQEAL